MTWVVIRYPDPADTTIMDFVYEYTPQRKVKTFSSDTEAKNYALDNIGADNSMIAPLITPKNLLSVSIQRREKG